MVEVSPKTWSKSNMRIKSNRRFKTWRKEGDFLQPGHRGKRKIYLNTLLTLSLLDKRFGSNVKVSIIKFLAGWMEWQLIFNWSRELEKVLKARCVVLSKLEKIRRLLNWDLGWVNFETQQHRWNVDNNWKHFGRHIQTNYVHNWRWNFDKQKSFWQVWKKRPMSLYDLEVAFALLTKYQRNTIAWIRINGQTSCRF